MRESGILERLLGDAQRDPLFKILFWGVVFSFGLMVLSAWLQVISRYFFNFPLGWTEELARVTMFWFAYLSIGLLVRRRRLMVVDAFVILLPPRWRLGLGAVNAFIGAAALAWLTILSVELMEVASGQSSPALQIPYALIYLSLPVGLAGAIVYLIAVGIADLKLARRPDGPSAGAATRQANG